MSLLPEAPLPDSFPPYEAFQRDFGFVPALFRAQSLLPRVIEAEAQIADAVLLAPGALTRVQKETILLTLAARHRNSYCVAAHRHFLRELGVPADRVDTLARNYHDADLPAGGRGALGFCSHARQQAGRHHPRRHRGAPQARAE